MPQGPPELHAKWESDFNAIKYLENRGYILTRDWRWIVPKGHEITKEEDEAIYYLFAEWDFGGVMV